MSKEKLLNIHFFLFCLLAAFPLLSMKVAAIIIITFFSCCTLYGIMEYKRINWKLFSELLVYVFPFLLIFIWTIGIDKSKEAHFYLERSLSLIAFPVAFFLLPIKFSDKQKDIFQLIFSFSALAEVLYGLIKTALYMVTHIGPDQIWKNTSDMFNYGPFHYLLRTFFEVNTSIHPTYACLYLGLAFLFLFNRLLNRFANLSIVIKLSYIFILSLMIFTQVILASRTPFVGTMFSAFVLYFLHLKRKIYILWAGLVIILASGLLFFIVPSFSVRFKEVSIHNNVLPTKENHDSFNIRTGIYQCSMEIVKDHWLIGVGPGKVQTQLNACYNTISKDVYNGENFNTHNQFLDYWAGMGILAPLSLLLLILYVPFKNKNLRPNFPFIICILFFISMLTENILIRQNGVVAFSFFISLYSFRTKESLKLTFFNKVI